MDIPDKFNYSLVQEYIDKKADIRVFYINGQIHATAIISQNDKQTKVDFRNYNKEKPNRIVPFNMPECEKVKLVKLMRIMDYESGSIDYAKSNIHWGNINVSMPLYTESLHYNTFFNRKVCINEEGDVFNYFTQNESFGNIHTEKLEKIIKKRNFQKLWTITKDTILTCSVCEFRYMCVDSRIPVQIKDGHWQHLTSCTYNPYICKWQGEEGYVPVEECGTYSRETGFVPDKKKIAKLNKLIWGEEE